MSRVLPGEASPFAAGLRDGWRRVEWPLLAVLAGAAALAAGGSWCLIAARPAAAPAAFGLYALGLGALAAAACAPGAMGAWATARFWGSSLDASSGARRPAADACGRFTAALAAVCLASAVPLTGVAWVLFGGGAFASPSALDRLGSLMAFCGSGFAGSSPGLASLLGPLWVAALLALPLAEAWWAASRAALPRRARRPVLRAAALWAAVAAPSGVAVVLAVLSAASLAGQRGAPGWLGSAAVIAEALLMATASALLVRSAALRASALVFAPAVAGRAARRRWPRVVAACLIVAAPSAAAALASAAPPPAAQQAPRLHTEALAALQARPASAAYDAGLGVWLCEPIDWALAPGDARSMEAPLFEAGPVEAMFMASLGAGGEDRREAVLRTVLPPGAVVTGRAQLEELAGLDRPAEEVASEYAASRGDGGPEAQEEALALLGQVREALAPFDDVFFAERSLVRVLSRASAGGASLAGFLRCDGALVACVRQEPEPVIDDLMARYLDCVAAVPAAPEGGQALLVSATS